MHPKPKPYQVIADVALRYGLSLEDTNGLMSVLEPKEAEPVRLFDYLNENAQFRGTA